MASKVGALLTSPLNLIPAMPERRAFRLKCRFLIGPGRCHWVLHPALPLCQHLERAAYDAGRRFLEEMERQGWESADGNLRLTGGPSPITATGTSTLPRPVPHQPLPRGPHPRFGPAYDSPVEDQPGVGETDGWEYEMSGWFVRPMLPTVTTVATARRLEAQRKARHGR